MNEMPKYVVSKTLHDPTWNNTTVLSGEPVTEITALKDTVARDILVAAVPSSCPSATVPIADMTSRPNAPPTPDL